MAFFNTKFEWINVIQTFLGDNNIYFVDIIVIFLLVFTCCFSFSLQHWVCFIIVVTSQWLGTGSNSCFNLFAAIPNVSMNKYWNAHKIPYHVFQQDLEDQLHQRAMPIILTHDKDLVWTVKKQDILLMTVLYALGMSDIVEEVNITVRFLWILISYASLDILRNK